ncbi:MAG: DUF6159 family protein [Terriglobia bacterium]|jgi:hypothetical protein
MGTLFRNWDLLGRSFTILKSDKELLWLPVMSALYCLAATLIICSAAAIVVVPPAMPLHDLARQKVLGQQLLPFVFLYYFVTYGAGIYFNVALVSIGSDRLAGGHAVLNEGLQTAWKRKWSIIQWALLAATVGVLLQMLERRLSLIGRIVTRITGYAWTLASFFVVPILAAEDMGPAEALAESAEIFRNTWGEEIAGSFSFGLITVVLALPGLPLPVLGARLGKTEMLAGVALMLIYWMLLALVCSAARGIFVAALYRYATTQQVSDGFHPNDLSGAWQRKQV